MGRVKELMFEYDDRGFGEVPDKNVCIKCFEDVGIHNFIDKNGARGHCSYCDTHNRKVVSLEDVIYHIQLSLLIEYQTDSNHTISHEALKEGLVSFDNADAILWNEGLQTNYEELWNDIVLVLDHNEYAENYNYYNDDRMRDLWHRFTDAIKHKSRFLFYRSDENSFEESEFTESRMMPYEIAGIIQEKNMLSTLSIGQSIYRARFIAPSKDVLPFSQSSKEWKAKDLGTVPEKYANFPNRMSPVGVPMFYGASTPETAILEILENLDESTYQMGVFTPSRDLLLIDFTKAPAVPSIFDEKECIKRPAIKFMKDFVADISRKISKDKNLHLDYIPTQVITEFLRYNFTHNGQKVDGIMFNSSRNKKDKVYVLFIENRYCIDDASQAVEGKPYLVCTSNSTYRTSLNGLSLQISQVPSRYTGSFSKFLK